MSEAPKEISNRRLRSASKAKADEFYTQMNDIEVELRHYRDYLKDKIVYCNCDDPYESNFFKYFAINFKALGLRKLITTSYLKSPIVGGQLDLFEISGLKPDGSEPFKIEITQVPDANQDGAVDLLDVELLLRHDGNVATPLKGDGDFRSPECIQLLNECDIVVTNPPFSLFRQFITLIEKHSKKFLVIGNTNAITYREIFMLFKRDGIRTGYTNFNKGMFFEVPDTWERFHHVSESGRKMARVSSACWFTNLEVSKHKQFLTLYKTYNPEEYPTYANFDAINVDRFADIPRDFSGLMGVPITFIDKYNPDQFEIVDINPHFFSLTDQGLAKPTQLKLRGRKDPYARLLIRNRHVKR
jgi:hypothetical protein